MKRLIYPERNRLLLILSILMLVSVIIIARYSTWPALPGFGFLVGTIPEDSILYDIAIGYFSSYVFYFIQVYLPQRNREKKALKTIELYLKAYLRNARLLYAVLQDYDFAKLPEYTNKIVPYRYSDRDGNSFIEDFRTVGGKDRNPDFTTDGIYNFLLKSKNLYEQMISNLVFGSVDAFVLNQVQAINILYWFETYEKILVLRQNGYGNEIRPFRSDDQQINLMQKLSMAIDRTEEYLGIRSIVSRMED